MRAAQHIRVHGVVQGVGFRPFVWRVARELGICGWVRNDSGGVEIAAEGTRSELDALLQRLRREAPPRARIDALQASDVPAQGLAGFHITASQRSSCATAIGSDSAVCTDCLQELFSPQDRRWRHPFITCTHCGPRYTITRSLPYDRSSTSMAGFAMCGRCAQEYANPADRRFHAEPIACPQCGPRLQLLDGRGAALAGDPIAAALAQLREGAIVAVKGLGGYQLACDARNAAAVARLRLRKQREAKPFALMAAGAASLAGLAVLDEPACQLLASPARPIVLLPSVPGATAALEGVAPGMAELGVMLPATPIHWLLFHEAAGRPSGLAWSDAPQALLLVMTSANPGGEPLVIDEREALQRLAGIADAFLVHDRAIVTRCDDSVVSARAPVAWVRRARGLAPDAIRLVRSGPPVLALGAHLKNTACVTRGNEAFLSQHVGDLDSVPGVAFLEETVERLLALLEVQPALIAHDLHPDMASTHLAASMAAQLGVPTLAVQHHHAHVAAVAAEHNWQGPLLGLVLDGVGLGTDGTAWGGELLHVAGPAMRRVGTLEPLALPGGDRAALEPWRMAAAALHRLGRGAGIAARFPGEPHARQLAAVLASGRHCPPTSSMGRVFDAAAALLGLATRQRFEAEAAMRLEACARLAAAPPRGEPDLWRLGGDGVLGLLPLLERLADWQGDVPAGAALFHETLVWALTAWVIAAARREGLGTVALGGGCFLNGLLRAGVQARLAAAGLRVLLPLQVPPNDGAISLGQAWVALATGGERQCA
jgi:hydrogenase maturation protein HypF